MSAALDLRMRDYDEVQAMTGVDFEAKEARQDHWRAVARARFHIQLTDERLDPLARPVLAHRMGSNVTDDEVLMLVRAHKRGDTAEVARLLDCIYEEAAEGFADSEG